MSSESRELLCEFLYCKLILPSQFLYPPVRLCPLMTLPFSRYSLSSGSHTHTITSDYSVTFALSHVCTVTYRAKVNPSTASPCMSVGSRGDSKSTQWVRCALLTALEQTGNTFIVDCICLLVQNGHRDDTGRYLGVFVELKDGFDKTSR